MPVVVTYPRVLTTDHTERTVNLRGGDNVKPGVYDSLSPYQGRGGTVLFTYAGTV